MTNNTDNLRPFKTEKCGCQIKYKKFSGDFKDSVHFSTKHFKYFTINCDENTARSNL